MLVFEVEYYETLISLYLLNVASMGAFYALPTLFEPNYKMYLYKYYNGLFAMNSWSTAVSQYWWRHKT
jgi:hypothetical protein